MSSKLLCCPHEGCKFTTKHQPSLSRHINQSKKHRPDPMTEQMKQIMALMAQQYGLTSTPIENEKKNVSFNDDALNIDEVFGQEISRKTWQDNDRNLKKVYVQRILDLGINSPICTKKHILFVKFKGEWVTKKHVLVENEWKLKTAREIIKDAMENAIGIHFGHLLNEPDKTCQDQDYRCMCVASIRSDIDLFNKGINFDDIDIETCEE